MSFERLLQTKWTYTKNCNLTIMVASWWWIQLQSDLPISMQHKSAPLLILSDALVGDISSAQFCWTWKDCKCKEHRLTLSAALNIEAIWRLHLMPNHCHEQFSVSGTWSVQRWRGGEERQSRPSRVALKHATKVVNSTLYALAGSVPGHMMMMPPIHIP